MPTNAGKLKEMNTQTWHIQFKEKHLWFFLNEAKKNCNEYDEYDEDDTKIVTEEGLDYFVIGNNFSRTRYSFNEEKVQTIQNELPQGWSVTDYMEMSDNTTKTIVEVKKENHTLSFEYYTDTHTYPRENMLKLHRFYNKNLEENRLITSLFLSKIFPNATLTTDSIQRLVSKEDLENLFGEATKHFDTPIENLRISPRGYNALSREGYQNVFDIVWNEPKQLFHLKQVGKQACNQIIETIDDLHVPWNIQEKILTLF